MDMDDQITLALASAKASVPDVLKKAPEGTFIMVDGRPYIDASVVMSINSMVYDVQKVFSDNGYTGLAIYLNIVRIWCEGIYDEAHLQNRPEV